MKIRYYIEQIPGIQWIVYDRALNEIVTIFNDLEGAQSYCDDLNYRNENWTK